MADWLPLFFVLTMGLSLLIYVILDGYDLGIGILLPFANDAEKDVMVAAIGPFWDANETWIVLGVGILLVAFPQAHGIVLSGLYVPITIMLIGLILRGVAFDFRVKAGDEKRALWNKLFCLGSALAAVSQGWMVGSYITGISGGGLTWLFSFLIAVSLPFLYIMLGSTWLMIKTEGTLFDKALRWAQLAVFPMGVALLLVSIATPLVSDLIADKWFTLPNGIGLLPIPLTTMIAYGVILWLLFQAREFRMEAGFGWLLLGALVVICLMATLGLAYSLFPDIILGRMTIYEAAASRESLQFVFVGTVVTLPLILMYTVFVYRVFGGKLDSLEYE
ncbi:MAG: cytochrome d ubiquinol oxidase subunit II [Pseudomonadales bacterium]|jgi:cytochrome d ubiquinol oxidase subunit II